jgi:hypothetical protein
MQDLSGSSWYLALNFRSCAGRETMCAGRTAGQHEESLSTVDPDRLLVHRLRILGKDNHSKCSG